MHPLRSKTTYTETLDGELCVYEWTRHEVHALNASAASVWQSCDGNTSVEEMAARLRAARLPYADQLVAVALDVFERKHLLDANRTPSRAGRAMSRRALVRCGVAAALVPVVTSIVAPTALQAQSPGGVTGTQTFAFTGSPATFVVPSGITSLTVSAFGASGSNLFPLFPGSRGGLGGSVTATLAVTPGETLGVNVGGISAFPNAQAAAFNGGGPGGSGAAAGGGASDVRRGGGALSNRVIVAGGGGGMSGSRPRVGGAGGGTTGASGESEVQSGAGGGGTRIAGGAGGTVPGSIAPPGTAGALGTGGAGSELFGGGGGGGYFGGGGGANFGANLGGGGGGGSSFADPSATAVVHLQGVRSGTGLIILSW